MHSHTPEEGGQDNVLTRVFLLNHNRLLNYATWALGNRDDADEAIQETGKAISASRESFSDKRAAERRVWTILRRRIIDIWRRRRRDRKPIQTAARGPPPAPDKAALDREIGLAIQQGLAELSEREREAFLLYHKQEFRIAEAAERMGCQPNAVKQYLLRARRKLQNLLKRKDLWDW